VTDAGMPMPALVFWMPMPTYAITKERPELLLLTTSFHIFFHIFKVILTFHKFYLLLGGNY
jgi:hypothetical protein